MEVLVENLTFLTWQQVLMWLIGGVLIYLAIVKEMEPSLLLPMGFGAILVNLPNSGAAEVIAHLFELGIAGHELFPLLLFIGIGAMIDFQPLLANPKLMIFGAAAQFGIFFTLGLASLLGFELNDAAPSPSSARRTAPRPSSSPSSLVPATRRPLWWRPIPTWRWCRWCSRRSSGCVQRRRSGKSR